MIFLTYRAEASRFPSWAECDFFRHDNHGKTSTDFSLLSWARWTTMQCVCTLSQHYCNVLVGLYSQWNFIALQKVNTLQLNTASNSSNTRTRPTSEFFQQDLLWQSSNTHSHSCSQKASKHTRSIRRRAIGPLAHHNGISANSPSLACHLPAPTIECLHCPPYKLTCSSRNFPIGT
jgi:hypothetical protein